MTGIRKMQAQRVSHKRTIFILVSALALLAIPVIVSTARTPETVTAATLSYRLEWEWGAAVPAENGQGWQVVNDLGYRVQVEQAYLVSYSVQLVECEHGHGETAFLDRVIDWLAPQTVSAGHGGDGDDPSLIHNGFVESFAMPENMDFGAVTISQKITYCQGHYLIARADSQIEHQPQDVDMFGTSLYIAGSYQAESASIATPFRIQTSLANGVLDNLDVPYIENTDMTPVHLVTGNQNAVVLIRRQLDSLFNGVDFASVSSDKIGKAVLWSLVADTDITITEGETFASDVEQQR